MEKASFLMIPFDETSFSSLLPKVELSFCSFLFFEKMVWKDAGSFFS